MDMYTSLLNDHRHMRDLIAQVFQTPCWKTRQALFHQIRQSLVQHTQTEERVLYPVLQDVMPEKALHGEEQHDRLALCLQHLSSMNTEDPRWLESFHQFKTLLEDHMADEEQSLIPVAQSLAPRREPSQAFGRRSPPESYVPQAILSTTMI